jgi:uncharacterized protein (DUF1810 family)
MSASRYERPYIEGGPQYRPAIAGCLLFAQIYCKTPGILGSSDDLKFHSSMTLFDAVSSDPKFAVAITKFYGGKPDQRTLDLLSR